MKVRNYILSIGLLVALITNMILFYHVYHIKEQLEFNHIWMVVKKLRADKLEFRIKRLEKKAGIKWDI